MNVDKDCQSQDEKKRYYETPVVTKGEKLAVVTGAVAVSGGAGSGGVNVE